MSIDFPSPASNGQIVAVAGGAQWRFDGVKWTAYTALTGSYLPLTGGSLSGRLNIADAFQGISYPSLSGGTHGFAWAWDGRLLAYVDNTFVGVVTTGGPYLPLTGGFVSGRVEFSNAGLNLGDLVLRYGAGYGQLYNDGSSLHIYANGHIFLDRAGGSQVVIANSVVSSGLMIQSAATGSYMIMYDDGNTHLDSTTTIWIGGANFVVQPTADMQSNVLVRGQLNANNGNLQIAGVKAVTLDGSYCALWTPNGYAAVLVGAGDPTNYYRNTNHSFGSINGGYTQASITNAGITSSGNVSAAGDVLAGNALYCNGMYWQNNAGFMYTPYAIRTDNYIRMNGLDISNNSGYLYSAGLWSGNDTITPGVLRRSPVGSIYKGGRLEMWYGSDWDNVCFGIGGGNFLFSPDLGTSGFYVTPAPFSDGRLKADIRDTEIDALAAVMATPVRAFSWNAEGIQLQPHIADPHVSIGFVAQEVEETMPAAVEPSPFEDRTLHIIDHNMTPYLVRAIQQLTARVAELERR